MIEEESCPGGADDCKFREKHELMLVEEIMRTIKQYNKDKEPDPCPACLRNTMLAVAALLHIQIGGRAFALVKLGAPRLNSAGLLLSASGM